MKDHRIVFLDNVSSEICNATRRKKPPKMCPAVGHVVVSVVQGMHIDQRSTEMFSFIMPMVQRNP